jgi:hypothetical protein
LALQPASANAATATMRNPMGGVQRIEDHADDRLVDTQEKQTIRFSHFARTVWPADRRLTLQGHPNIAGLRVFA